MEIKDIRRDNLNLLAGEHGRTTIAQKLGYPDNNYINQLCGGHTNIGNRTARKIEAALDLEKGWMDYPHAAATLGEPHGKYKPAGEHDPAGQGRVPMISWEDAGNLCGLDETFDPDAVEWLPCPVSHSDQSYALRVSGDSMTSPYPGQRTYPEGAIIFVDTNKKVTNGCRVIAKLDGEVTFKTYSEDMGRTYLRPINPSYPAMDITDKEISFCGVVLGSFIPE
ncbi:LexA family protein [Microbulbifer sp. JSM ZJ756]|uniref:LexA family protein n=1 Tax=Microbulbifer sp. JSM ZJ756 TaxID=3376191 RepID=UPI0037B7C863